MADKPKVSTITAFYKKGKYLEYFLEDLPNQTYFPHIEVVFDHNEPAVIESELISNFQKKYPDTIKHIITNPVKPLGVSWNRCIHESSGEYLAIWNIDDLRTQQSIEKQAGYLATHSDVGIVSGNFTSVDKFPSTTGKFVKNSNLPYGELTKRMNLGPFFMFRKSLLEKAGLFDEQFRCANDFDLAIRLMYHTKAHILPDNLGYFLNEGEGASTKKGSSCPVESTVIQLRYGIYDQIDYQFIPAALKYHIYDIKTDDEWVPVSQFIPDYETMLEERLECSHLKGLLRNVGYSVFRKLRNMIKKLE
jgi:glycosyltransferase involved in cell wall biosynthesis